MSADILNIGLAIALIVSVAGALATFTLLLDLASDRVVRRVDRSIEAERSR